MLLFSFFKLALQQRGARRCLRSPEGSERKVEWGEGQVVVVFRFAWQNGGHKAGTAAPPPGPEKKPPQTNQTRHPKWRRLLRGPAETPRRAPLPPPNQPARVRAPSPPASRPRGTSLPLPLPSALLAPGLRHRDQSAGEAGRPKARLALSFPLPSPTPPPPRARAVPRYRHVQPPSSRGGGGGGGNGNGAAPPRARPDSGSGVSSPSLSPRFTDSGLSAAGLEGVSAGLGGRSAAPGKGGDPGGLGQGHGPGSGAEEPAPPPVSPPPSPLPPSPFPLLPAMADNEKLDNQRLKNFKNKGRDLEVTAAAPCGRGRPVMAAGGRAGGWGGEPPPVWRLFLNPPARGARGGAAACPARPAERRERRSPPPSWGEGKEGEGEAGRGRAVGRRAEAGAPRLRGATAAACPAPRGRKRRRKGARRRLPFPPLPSHPPRGRPGVEGACLA